MLIDARIMAKRNLVIIGAGGFGRTVYGIALECEGYGSFYTVKGFLDDNLNALDNFPNYPPIVGKISDYKPSIDDVFICAIGGSSRRTVTEKLLSQGADFINLIHQTARIRTNVQLGKGNIICPFVSIGVDSSVGSYNIFQSFTTIGHDVIIGDFNRIDTHVTCVSGVRIGNDVDIYTSSVINNGVVIEDGAHVGACSFVIKKVKSGTTVLGVPAKVIF